MARPNSLQMLANSPPIGPITSSSTGTSPSPNAPTPASTPAPPPGTSPSASGISAVSAHPSYIQRHFRRRLQASKQACDTELKKVIHAVTAYVEHSLRAQQEAEWEEEEESRVRDRDDLLAVESTSDDAGDESDAGGGVRRKNKKVSNTHRHRRSFMLSSGTKLPPIGTSSALAIPGTSATHTPQEGPQASGPSTSPVRMSASSSPTSTWSRASNPVARRASRSRRFTLSPPLPATVPGSIPPAIALAAGGSVPHPPSLTPSRASSRSRSRSPLPAATARVRSPIGSPTSQASPSDVGGAGARVDFITTLRDLVSLSTTLVEMPLSTLTSPTSPHALSEIVQNVQALGKAWDLRPDWHGRGWYVQVLLAVASLSRVVEWWQAEREFWHFGEEGEDEEDGEVEGMTFVLKPAGDDGGRDGGSSGGEESTDKERDRDKPEGEKGFDREQTVMPDEKMPSPLRITPPKEREDPLSGTQLVPAAPSPIKDLRSGEPPLHIEISRLKATEDLRAIAEKAMNEQVVMEIGLDGERILWVSPSWEKVVGGPADNVAGTSIISLLAPADQNVFAEATHHLEVEDPHTIEAKFLMLVNPPTRHVEGLPSPQDEGRPYFIEMDAKGMLVKDRIGGEASHTLWLFRPLPTASPISPSTSHLQQEQFEPLVTGLGVDMGGDTKAQAQGAEEEQEVAMIFHERGKAEPVTPFPFERPINTQTILCRICECQVPDWFFEKHNESCNEVHTLEADIVECDESLQELVGTISQMIASIDRLGQASPGPGPAIQVAAAQPSPPVREPSPEYRGVPLFTPATAPSSPLQSGGLRTSASARLQRVTVRKMQRKVLEDLLSILQAAREIDMPAVNEEAPNVPLERRPFLDPASEERVALVNAWQKPQTDDPALAQLGQDAETLMRTKVDYVNRMISTLTYSEKVRVEWEETVEQTLQEMESQAGDEADSESSESDQEDKAEGEVETDRPPSTEQPTMVAPTPIVLETSSGDQPTVVAPSPILFEAPSSSLGPVLSQSPANLISVFSPPSMSPSPPTSLSSVSSPYLSSAALHSASPHPISPLTTSPLVPSPLAFTTPILAHRESDDHPASEAAPSTSLAHSSLQMTLGSPAGIPSPMPSVTMGSMHVRRATVNALPEPTVMVTPPFSPTVPSAAPSSMTLPPPTMTASQSSKHNRRLSTALPFSPAMSAAPLSPRIPSIAPTSKTTPSSIRDFEIIKPISKGAFGSVYLSKKKSTGDYYAIKVLKKADMIAKNQVTNVKAERTILMQQADSPFVVKLFFTFQNKDYLYLVMEYLNGGDCAALIKTIGALPEDWAKTYVAEVVLSLENIHARGIVHRDLKPDNLLIDSRGHLKLTDFGLSRIGLFGRQARDGRALTHRRGSGNNRGRTPRSGFPSRQGSIDSNVVSPPPDAPLDTPSSYGTSYFSRGLSPSHLSTAVDDVSESSGSESISGMFQRGVALASESPQQSFASELTSDLRAYNVGGGGTPPGEQKFVGTPDYLAPETILATSEDDRAVDWWALGVITYEFLYGFPPFHAESPAQVFDNIISRRIEWYEDHIDYSKEARDFMERLMCTDPTKRLGFKSAQEVKSHSWLRGIDWDHLTAQPAQFVPQITDPESTDYFDPRGAHLQQLFPEEDPTPAAQSVDSSPRAERLSLRPGSTHPMDTPDPGLSPAIDDFGAFSFKNLPVLKQANDDVIKKLKAENSPLQGPGSLPLMTLHGRRGSISQRLRTKQGAGIGISVDAKGVASPPSPSTSTSSIASTPSRGNFPPITPGGGSPGHVRRPSEHGVLDRFKTQHDDGIRRNSMPSRLRTASVSSGGDHTSGTEGTGSWQPPPLEVGTPATSVGSHEMRRGSDPKVDRTVVCLLAEDNVISQKVQEILLTRLGCRCVLVADGYEAILAACSEIQFDCILMDYQMPILDGEVATKFIKGTNNKNKMTPVIAVSAYSALDPSVNADLFAASIAKPVQRDALLTIMKKLGFKVATETVGSKQTHKVVVK